jgi:hypothetical protein
VVFYSKQRADFQKQRADFEKHFGVLLKTVWCFTQNSVVFGVKDCGILPRGLWYPGARTVVSEGGDCGI